MRTFLCIVVAALILAGCATQKHVESSHTDQNYSSYRDSLYKASQQRDSIYLRDSIYILDKGDTIYKYTEKTQYKYIYMTDTLYKVVQDSLLSVQSDTVMVKETVAMPLAWYDLMCVWLGRIAGIALLGAMIIYKLKK